MILGTLKKSDGFTLLETMIAVVIFAAVSAAGVAVLSGFASGSRAIASSDDFLAGVSRFHSTLADDTAHYAPRPVRSESGGVEAAFSVITDDPAVLFHLLRRGLVRAPDGNTLVPGVLLIEYRVQESTLVRRTYDRADRLMNTGFQDETLLRGIDKMALRYQKNTVWLSDWLPVAVGASTAPDLVEITITFAEKGDLTSVYALAGGAV